MKNCGGLRGSMSVIKTAEDRNKRFKGTINS